MDKENTLNRYDLVSNFTIDKSKLKQSQYMLSLLKEGQNVGVITSEKAYKIQVEIMQILQRLIGPVHQRGKYVGYNGNGGRDYGFPHVCNRCLCSPF